MAMVDEQWQVSAAPPHHTVGSSDSLNMMAAAAAAGNPHHHHPQDQMNAPVPFQHEPTGPGLEHSQMNGGGGGQPQQQPVQMSAVHSAPATYQHEVKSNAFDGENNVPYFAQDNSSRSFGSSIPPAGDRKLTIDTSLARPGGLSIPPIHSAPYGTTNPTTPSPRIRRRMEFYPEHMALLFSSTKQYYDLWSYDKSIAYKVQIQARMDRGFFLANNDWTCYRRNYFQVSTTFTVHSNYSSCPETDSPNLVEIDGKLQPVAGFLLGITARVSNSDKKVELVQLTPKRDKGPQSVPTPKTVKPGGNLTPLASISSCQNVVTFERVQFKSATANNGKRRAAQQYYVLDVSLYVQLESGEQHRIGTCTSARLVVRGRSPGHYADAPNDRGIAFFAGQGQPGPDGTLSAMGTRDVYGSSLSSPFSPYQPFTPYAPFSPVSPAGHGQNFNALMSPTSPVTPTASQGYVVPSISAPSSESSSPDISRTGSAHAQGQEAGQQGQHAQQAHGQQDQGPHSAPPPHPQQQQPPPQNNMLYQQQQQQDGGGAPYTVNQFSPANGYHDVPSPYAQNSAQPNGRPEIGPQSAGPHPSQDASHPFGRALPPLKLSHLKTEDGMRGDQMSPATPATPAPPLSAGPFLGTTSPRNGTDRQPPPQMYGGFGTAPPPPQHPDSASWVDHTPPHASQMHHPSHPSNGDHPGHPPPMQVRTGSLNDMAGSAGPATPRSELSNLMSCFRMQKE